MAQHRHLSFLAGFFLMTALCDSLFCASLQAQEADTSATELRDALNTYLDQSSLSNIDVSAASRFAQSIKQAPATLITVTADQIRRRGYQSLHDVLQDLPDIKAETFSEPGTLDNFNIRGVRGQQKFIVLLNGFRISAPTNEPVGLMENYPVHLAKQVEVLYGPASVLYGADAVSGVINIITKKYYDLEGRASINLMGGGELAEQGSGGRFDGNALYGQSIGEKSSFIIGGHYTSDRQPNLPAFYPDEFQGIKSLETGVFNTAFGQFTVPGLRPQFEYPYQAGAFYGGLDLENFKASVFFNEMRAPGAATYTPDNAVYNREHIYNYRQLTFNSTYTREFAQVFSQTLLTGSRYELDPNSYFQNVFNGVRRGYKFGVSSMLKLEQILSWQATEQLSLIGGGTLESFTATPKGADLQSPVNRVGAISATLLDTQSPILSSGISSPTYTVEYQNYGGFLQAQLVPSELISITLGARYDYNTRYQGTFNPRLGIVVRPSKRLTFKALYGSAFLAPSPFDAYEFFGSFQYDSSSNAYSSGFWRLPNPDLKPIQSQTVELGGRVQLTENFSLSLTGYYARLTSLFRTVEDAKYGNRYNNTFLGYPVGYIEVYVNQGEQNTYGGSVQLDHLFTARDVRVESYASLSLVDGTIDTDDSGPAPSVQIGGVSPVMVKAGTQVSWQQLDAAANFVFIGQQRTDYVPTDSDKRATIDGYALLNLFLTYRVIEPLSVTVRITNALDVRYRTVNRNAGVPQSENYEFSNGTPQNPIRLSVGVRAAF